MSGTGKLLTEKQGQVGWITFDNPARLNAMSNDMYRALPEAVEGFDNDREVRVICLKGAGRKAFISGADISEFGDQRNDGSADEYDEAWVTRLERAAKPTVAMIRGYCIGGGLEIALACDVRVATAASRFAIPAAKLGLGYPASSLRKLMSVIGSTLTKEILFTGRQLTADEALRIGLVNRVVDDAALEANVGDYCERMARNAPLTIDATKRIVAELEKDEPDDELCERLYRRCFESEDYTEGWTAFLEKRPPQFKGR